MINDNISIKYKDRDKTISEVVNEINAYINSKVGNYLVYLPSFEYLNKIKDFFKDDERFIQGEALDLIRCQELTFPDGPGLPVLRRII